MIFAFALASDLMGKAMRERENDYEINVAVWKGHFSKQTSTSASGSSTHTAILYRWTLGKPCGARKSRGISKWRRGRDSNPRQGSTLNTLSRRAISTTHPPLRGKLRIVAERGPQEIPLRLY